MPNGERCNASLLSLDGSSSTVVLAKEIGQQEESEPLHSSPPSCVLAQRLASGETMVYMTRV